MFTKPDIVIVGSGVAGLATAVNIALKKQTVKILILTKAKARDGNSFYAQGGMAVVTDFINDSYEQHIQDTFIAGDKKNNLNVVRKVVSASKLILEHLKNWSIELDIKDNNFDLGLEGGHTKNRIIHRKDFTGKELEQKLLAQVKKNKNIQLIEYAQVKELIVKKTQRKLKCIGLKYFDLMKKNEITLYTKCVVMASGGVGQLFNYTTNSIYATGEGIALSSFAGAKLKDIEYIQFHPTALYEKNKKQLFLISEAVRGEGAYLLNQNNKRFMFNYDKRGDLAPRDIVSRSIYAEMKYSNSKNVFLDCREIEDKNFIKKFPTIYKKCKSIGIDPLKELIPVVPAAHYICGGVKTNIHGQTSIENLYAIGECACTGLHGANRLASNSLLENIYFSIQTAYSIVKRIDAINHSYKPIQSIPYKLLNADDKKSLFLYKKQLKNMATNTLGIIKIQTELRHSIKKINFIISEINSLNQNSPEYIEIKNQALLVHQMLKTCLAKKINAGTFYKISS